MAAALNCSTPFTPGSWGTLPTTQRMCVLVCPGLHFCVCAVCVCVQVDWEVVSVCLGLLVILA